LIEEDMSSNDHALAHDAHAHDGHDGDGAVHSHISSVKFYLGIFATLIFFTLLTVAVSYVHLGPANLAVAIAISSTKAALVVLFFMHLRHDNKFNALIFVCSLLFIGVFFAYTMNDTSHRGEVDTNQGGTVLPATGKDAPGGFPAKPHESAKAHEGEKPPAPGVSGGKPEQPAHEQHH
jgi:cytochrome c oxidase subunit 4